MSPVIADISHAYVGRQAFMHTDNVNQGSSRRSPAHWESAIWATRSTFFLPSRFVCRARCHDGTPPQEYVPVTFGLTMFALGTNYDQKDVDSIVSKLLAVKPARRQPEAN
jgi:hypothetical protein